jgi:cell wall-associated NlpC family hydrolase
MWNEQTIAQEGVALSIARRGTERERWTFASPQEAAARKRFIEEAFTWVGTPFRDCADVKGRNGAVDCAMLLVRCAVDTGLVAPFDPRPYSPRWHVHRNEEKFLDILTSLGARETETPRPGDVLVFRFGRTYAHGGILVNAHEVVHAYGAAGMVIVSRLDEPLLKYISFRKQLLPRPMRCFDIWSERAA